jgi:hypothetical protein
MEVSVTSMVAKRESSILGVLHIHIYILTLRTGLKQSQIDCFGYDGNGVPAKGTLHRAISSKCLLHSMDQYIDGFDR